MGGGVIYGLLQRDTFLLLEHGQYVVRIVPGGLLLVIGVDVLRVVIKLANNRHDLTVTHVCDGDQIRRICLHELENRVVEYLIREVEPKAAAEHPERSENSAISTSDQGIGVHVEHDVFLAELGFHSEAVDIMLHVLQEAVVRRFTGCGEATRPEAAGWLIVARGSSIEYYALFCHSAELCSILIPLFTKRTEERGSSGRGTLAALVVANLVHDEEQAEEVAAEAKSIGRGVRIRPRSKEFRGTLIEDFALVRGEDAVA